MKRLFSASRTSRKPRQPLRSELIDYLFLIVVTFVAVAATRWLSA